MSKRSGQNTLDFFVSKKSRTSDPEPTLASTSVDQDHNVPGSDLSAQSGNVNQDYQEEKQNVAGAWTDARAAQYSGLPLTTCVGIGTDTSTCSLMLSDQKGAVSAVQEKLNNAVKYPCYNHCLNLSISKSSNIQDIRNAVGTIKETIAFFNASSKRNKVLKFVNSAQLISLCETRWIERHRSVLQFKN
nr:unnamed protein product [Callosobruchus analis]